MTGQPPPDIFDRRRRYAMRERAGRREGHDSFLWMHIADDLAERLAIVRREFDHIAIIGPLAAHADHILAGRPRPTELAALSMAERVRPESSVIEEDLLPFEPGRFDLIICAGSLDSANDLPGALLRMRFALEPDGLFLGHMFGAGTLSSLKAAMVKADQDRAVPHIHPQIELQSAAELLGRAGFALPVADMEVMAVRYSGWRRLVEDLRDAGVGNALAGGRAFLGHDYPQRLEDSWSAMADDDGKVAEHFVHIHMSGWAPSPDQPRPARRGSGISLTQILPNRNHSDDM